MTRGELCDLLIAQARKHRLHMQYYIGRDYHMHDLPEDEMPSQHQIDVVLMVFLNKVAYDQGIDLGLYQGGLQEESDAEVHESWRR